MALQAVASHIPERAERHIPVPGYGENITEAQPGSFRPLLIFTHPEPVNIIAAVPDGPPLRMTWRRVSRRIVKAEGPERIAPEWWRLEATALQRDYFRIEDEQGRRYWVFRDGLYGEGRAPPKWFVHGLSA
jgi:protein ImuB